jgi:hypothetical protein
MNSEAAIAVDPLFWSLKQRLQNEVRANVLYVDFIHYYSTVVLYLVRFDTDSFKTAPNAVLWVLDMDEYLLSVYPLADNELRIFTKATLRHAFEMITKLKSMPGMQHTAYYYEVEGV